MKNLTRNFFFCTVLGFTQSHLGSSNVPPDRYIQMIAGTYKTDKLINITGNDKIHLKVGCFIGGFVNGVREPILDSFGLSSPPGH